MVNLSIDSISATDSIDAVIINSSLFDEPFENTTYHFEKSEDCFTVRVPVETTKSIVGLIVKWNNEFLALGLLELKQDKPLNIKGRYDSAGIIHFVKSDNTGVNDFDLKPTVENKGIIISEALTRFASYHMGDSDEEPEFEESDYDSWEKVSAKYDSLYQVQKDYALNGCTLPDVAAKWVDNCMKYFFAANWRMPYKERAEKTFGINIEIADPPAEYFTFLNDIDYSAVFLDHSQVFGPNLLLKKILDRFGIEKNIGEKPISEWQDDVRSKISPAISNPTPILLDLLAAAAYISQIEEDNTPLTQSQASNIEHGFDKGVTEMIMNHNEKLITVRGMSHQLINFEEDRFSLIELLDNKCKDNAVVVDLWNTWCMPCLSAMREIDNISINYGSVRRVYISDWSSPLDNWTRHAQRIGGIQVRISPDDMQALFEKYDLKGFPSYIFFDKNHKLVHLHTGFQGVDEYLRMVKELQ